MHGKAVKPGITIRKRSMLTPAQVMKYEKWLFKLIVKTSEDRKRLEEHSTEWKKAFAVECALKDCHNALMNDVIRPGGVRKSELHCGLCGKQLSTPHCYDCHPEGGQ